MARDPSWAWSLYEMAALGEFASYLHGAAPFSKLPFLRAAVAQAGFSITVSTFETVVVAVVVGVSAVA